MCLAIPMKLIERREALGVAELDGVRREVSLMLQPEVEVGDFVLVHAGYAIGVVDEAEANATLEVLRQAADSLGTP
ncbi:MAG: hydrogenase assembly protein HypC [Acidobacteria bacterium 37-65-4]|nr:MAG: hydrogenase assembly protein HypC [Acidobacteria bacterium 37-65-4]HQT94124.1 HypC/HybG/HupF family hydrogenase formation chaperone [Thermoanaerobaculaceae bacterium]